jgi:DNA polymerase-3 subunit gamma/tau
LDGASNNSVDEIRNLVDKVRIPPQMGKYKVYIIDEVHMLSASAFNAFLKTLEEPPPYAKFILATTEKHKIIPTILSRCQIFDFKRITVDDIASHLQYVAQKEEIETEEAALHIIAQKADGAMRDALSIFDQLVSFAGNRITYDAVLENLNVLDYEYFFRITAQILNEDIPGTLITINEILGKGFDGQHFLIGFGEHLRNLLVCRDPVTVKLLETAPNIRARYQAQSEECPADFLLAALDINNKCDLNYKISNNKRLHLELALLQMCSLRRHDPRQSQQTPALKQMPDKPVSSLPPRPAEPIRQAPPVKLPEAQKPIENKPFAGTFSIKQAPENKVEEPVVQATAEATIVTPVEGEVFSQQFLELAWREFIESLQPDASHLLSILRKSQPVVTNDYLIEFNVENKLMEDELHAQRNEVLGFLRNRLKNNRIELKINVIESNKTIKPYTDREKFARMAEKNPAIIELKDQLNLEID